MLANGRLMLREITSTLPCAASQARALKISAQSLDASWRSSRAPSRTSSSSTAVLRTREARLTCVGSRRDNRGESVLPLDADVSASTRVPATFA